MKDFVSIDVHTLLPQQEPFVMIGSLKHFEMGLTITETLIAEGNIFVENGEFTSAGLIENIAQTCAARIGYINKYILKKAIQLGFIGVIKGLKIHRLPKVGEIITTSIETIEEIFGMTLVKSVVKVGDEVLAVSEMKIALSEVESQN